ncbi:MAG TPA: hypothetical protein P5337_07740 [Aestuariivirga sp.]|mgnify:CR=1 FL=1|nr:hypothetical protein [Alphaproteobacteria bacterium]HRX36274.1 hypothetical protein [Aestuariivirga sp.]
MTRFALALFASTMLLAPATTIAGEIADHAMKAEDLLAAGNHEDAIKNLEAAQDLVWQESPLLFRRALFAAGEPAGYGMYDLREGSTFKRSEPLIIYAEPMGYGYGRDGSLYQISLDLDFSITDATGNVVASQENFGNLSIRSRFPNKEFMAKVTYDFSGLPPGDYKVTTRAKDKNTGKTGDFTLAFTLED